MVIISLFSIDKKAYLVKIFYHEKSGNRERLMIALSMENRVMVFKGASEMLISLGLRSTVALARLVSLSD